jgi:hypothetical protein
MMLPLAEAIIALLMPLVSLFNWVHAQVLHAIMVCHGLRREQRYCGSRALGEAQRFERYHAVLMPKFGTTVY